MRGFHFGKVARDAQGVRGEYALHVDCPWRIESGNEIITGFHDWYNFAGDVEPDDWEPARDGGSLQELRLRELFASPLEIERAIVNRASRLVVTNIASDAYGGCRIILDNHLCIAVFPCASTREHWRLFRTNDESPHLVSEGPTNLTGA
jgi:hypothetical protein